MVYPQPAVGLQSRVRREKGNTLVVVFELYTAVSGGVVGHMALGRAHVFEDDGTLAAGPVALADGGDGAPGIGLE